MSATQEDYAEYVSKDGDGWTISKEVPGGQIPYGHGTFETHADAVQAVKIAFSAYRAGMWRKQQDFRDLLGMSRAF